MDVVNEVLSNPLEENTKYKPTTVEKHLDVEYDVGALMVYDPNELNNKLLSGNEDEYLLNLTRDNVQLLINEIFKLPTEMVDETIVAKLPPRRTLLPRSRPVPKPKKLTKWQEFAKAKGIVKKKKGKIWDEKLKRYIPTFGYQRNKANMEKDWLLEVPDNADPMEDQFAKKAEAKSERIAKNELQRLRNIAKARNIKVPRMGVVNPEASSAKDLQAAVTIAKSSTASLGKFQPKLPHEKEARGVSAITPGASRKRKLAPVSAEQERAENLNIMESVLNKRPKLDIEKAVSRHINQEQVQRSEEKKSEKPRKAGRGGKAKKGGGSGKGQRKPKAGKGQRKPGSGGRKRR